MKKMTKVQLEEFKKEIRDESITIAFIRVSARYGGNGVELFTLSKIVSEDGRRLYENIY